MFEKTRRNIARWIAPAKTGLRMYAGAKVSRMTYGFGSSTATSADAELHTSLSKLRSRSRQLMRDAPYAKRICTIIVNNVVGSGVGMQAQVMTTRNALAKPINDAIEREWSEWMRATAFHTGGSMHFSDFERACMSEVVTAGEVFIRKFYRPFGESRVPFSLEMIEAERLADDSQALGTRDPNVEIRMGVELDSFGRAVAYWMRERHPGDMSFRMGSPERFVRVPADQIIHLRKVDRWPQSRGEPWLHGVMLKLDQMNEYTKAEVTAANMAANYFATIESPSDDPIAAEKDETGAKSMDIEPGVIEQLAPGDALHFHSPNRPNTALSEFMRHMLREIASGTGVSYESVSRDYSQSNYSSSRLSLLDDRDLWRVIQQWWIRAFREPLHREWLQYAVLSRAISEISAESFALNPDKYRPVLFKPRGWSWVDPTKEVEAYKEAVRAGFTTTSSVIAQTADGRDLEDIIAERKRELDLLREADLVLDTEVVEPVTPAPSGSKPTTPDPAATEEPSAATGRAYRMGHEDGASDVVAQMAHGNRELVDAMLTREPPTVIVHPPNITLNPPNIIVESAQVNVSPPDVRIEPAQVNVTISKSGRKEIEIVERDEDGFAKRVIQTESD